MNVIALFFTAVAIAVFVSFLLALPVMLLWDAIMPAIFGLTTITWMQAWCLSLLCGLLFKSNITTKKE